MWFRAIAILLLLGGCEAGTGTGGMETAGAEMGGSGPDPREPLLLKLDLPPGVQPVIEDAAFHFRVERQGLARERAYPMGLVSGPLTGRDGRTRWTLGTAPTRTFLSFIAEVERLTPSARSGTIEMMASLILCRDARSSDLAAWMRDKANWVVLDTTIQEFGNAPLSIETIARPYAFGDPPPVPVLPCSIESW